MSKVMSRMVCGLAASAALIGGAVTATSASASSATSPVVNNSTRASALSAYNTIYKPALAVASGSTGNTSTCSAGTISSAGANATLTTINYFRSMEHLAPTTLNASWSTGAQSSALMMAANGQLNHTPPASWKCYSALGAKTAGQSNLAQGLNSNPGAAMAQYLDDSGNAGTLGHRRWVLDPGLGQVGVGQVGAYNALQVFSGGPLSTPAGTPAYSEWPAAGYVPKALVPSENTWSFTSNNANADMSGAMVSVKNGSTNVPVTVTHLANGYGKPTVEFKPGSAYTGGADKAYTVTVSGMKLNGATLPAYTYTTTLFDESYAASPASTVTTPLAADNAMTWAAPASVKVGSVLPITASTTSGAGTFQFHATMTQTGVCSFAGGAITFGAPGTCTVTVTQPATSTYKAASLTRTFSVTN